MNLKTNFIPCLALTLEAEIRYLQLVAKKLVVTDFGENTLKEILWAGGPSSRGVSYRIISNLLYTCFSGVCSKVYFGIKILIVTIRFQCEFKDQTVYYYACAIQTKAWAPKIKVIPWYLGLENLFNSIGLQICTSRSGAYYLHNK